MSRGLGNVERLALDYLLSNSFMARTDRIAYSIFFPEKNNNRYFDYDDYYYHDESFLTRLSASQISSVRRALSSLHRKGLAFKTLKDSRCYVLWGSKATFMYYLNEYGWMYKCHTADKHPLIRINYHIRQEALGE